MTTLNIRALQRLEEKIQQRLEIFKEEVFDSQDFPQFTRYQGFRNGLTLALDLCREVEQEINS